MTLPKRFIPFVVVGCFVVVALLWFLPSYSVGFLADDYDWLKHVVEAKTEGNAFFQLATESIGGATFFRPVINWSFLLDHTLFGFHAIPYHIVNILLFGLGCGLFAVFLQKITGKTSVGITASFLFLLNPYTAETVTWIAGRTDLWLLVFLLATLLALHAYRHHPSKKTLVALVVFFLGAVFAKENGIILLPLFLVLDFFFYKPKTRQRTTLLPYVVAFGVLLVFFAARFAVLGFSISTTNVFGRSTFQLGTWEDVTDFLSFAFVDFFHANAGAWLPFSLATTNRVMIVLLSAFVALFILERKEWQHRARFLLLGIVITLVLLAPTLGFVSFVTKEHANTRFLFIPMLGTVVLYLALCSGARFRILRCILFSAIALLWFLAAFDSQFPYRRAANIHAATFTQFQEQVVPFLSGPLDAVLLSNLPGTREGVFITPNDFEFALKMYKVSANVQMFGNLPLPNSALCDIANGTRTASSVHVFRWDDTLGFTEQTMMQQVTFDATTPLPLANKTVINPTGFSELIIPVLSWNGTLQGAKTHLRIKLHADEVRNDDYTLPVPITEAMLNSGAITIPLCEYPRFFEREEIRSWKLDWRGFDDAEVEFGTPFLQ